MRNVKFVWVGMALGLGAAGAIGAGQAHAGELVNGGKLLLTGGVSNVEGAGGGGIASWATITGYETRDGIGANVHATHVFLPDYDFSAYGVGVGLYDRLELSYSRQAFDTGKTGAKLGIGSGFTFNQDVYGAKLRIAGDAIYDQDKWLPQISVGVQYKRNDKGSLVRALGAKHDSGVDYYVSATKLLLAQSLLLNGTVRYTEANQTGLLGFGGTHGYQAQFEGSAAWLVNRHLAIGAEYRTKPSNLSFAKERDWKDLFVAYGVNKHLSITLAYADLGDIATFKNQHGLYLSAQVGF
jgi:hypothetical protein